VSGYEDYVALFTGLFAEFEFDRAVVEVFQEGDFIQSVLRKVWRLFGGL